MTYDPLAYVSNKGRTIANVGQQLGQLVAAMPDLYKQDKMYKDTTEANNVLYTEAVDGLQKIGVDSATAPKPMEGEKREDYVKRVVEFVSPHIVGPGNKINQDVIAKMGIAQNPNIQEASQRQSFLNTNDPLSQIDMSKMQTSGSAMNSTPANNFQGSVLDSSMNPNMGQPNTEARDTLSGALGPNTSDPLASSSPNTGESFSVGASSPVQINPPQTDHFDSLAKGVNDAVRAGTMHAGDAWAGMAKIQSQKHDLELADKKIQLANIKAEADAAKARNQKLEDYNTGLKDSRADDKTKMDFDAEQARLKREADARNAALSAAGKATKEDKSLIQIDKTLRSDYIVKQRTEQAQYAKNTLALLTSDNPVANQAAKTQLARLSGEVGVLTDKDTERFGGSKALVAKVEQKVQEALSGRLTKENQAFLMDVASSFAEAAQTSLSQRLTELALGQSEAFEVPMERITPLVNAYGITTKKTIPAVSGSNIIKSNSGNVYNLD